MTQALAVRLVNTLGSVDSVERTLAVCHLEFMTGKLAKLQYEDFTICGAYSYQLDRFWKTARELALLDARILFGSTDEELDTVDSQWSVWSRRLVQQLELHGVLDSDALGCEVADIVGLFADVRNCIVAITNKPDSYKQDFTLLLCNPLL